jgi:hypothetical protein
MRRSSRTAKEQCRLAPSKKSKKSPLDTALRSSLPRRLACVVAVVLVATLGLAGFDLLRDRRHALTTGDASLRDLARVSEALWSADEARIQALLARLRIELRSDARWTATRTQGNVPSDPVAIRSTRTLLRRALEGTPEIRSIDLVVAGQEGLSSLRVSPDSEGEAASASGSADLDRDLLVKALWYSDEVQRAVEARGRRVSRGELTIDSVDGAPRPAVRTAIALHDGDETVQGALVATIELGPLGTRLASLASPDTRFTLVAPDGTHIGDSPNPPTGAFAAPEKESAESDADAAPVARAIRASAGLRSLLAPAPDEGGGAPSVYFWIERDAPASLLVAFLRGPWLLAVVALGALFGSLLAWDRALQRAGGVAPGGMAMRTVPRASAGVGARDALAALEIAEPVATTADGDDAPIRRERFVLRDWLADVRGCLEREAATRGLTLDLRCETTLPREIEQDPLWLGGLLVSLGREALDSTRASRVALEVTGVDAAGLRFEIDAGPSDLEAVAGMTVLAARLGARLDEARAGRLAIVVPDALVA